MLSVDEIKKHIDADAVSERKRYAKIGQQYYEGNHDIKNSIIFFIDADGEMQVDKTKSNIKIAHPFLTELTDQGVQYIFSGEGRFFRSDDTALQAELDRRYNENDDFKAELMKALTGASVKGNEYMYAYKNAKGKTAYMCADSLGVVEVRAKETQDGCDYIIYCYVDRITGDNRKIKRIQVWDKSQTFFYVQVENGKIEFDKSEKINPRPHTIYKQGETEQIFYEDYGQIPFIRLDNNFQQTSDLMPIKDLIDDYDLLNCGLSNNIQDAAEALYVVRGFDGDNLDELMLNIKAKKHVGVPDASAGVDVMTVTIPVEARKTKLEIDEQNIYRFGFGLNTHGLKDTAATTSIAIKSAYSLLDLKTNKKEIMLKRFLRKLLEIDLKEINTELGTDYRQSDVYFRFDREIPTNALENAQIELTEAQKRQTEINTILGLQMHLDDETRLKLICEQLDIDYEQIKDKRPRDEGDEGLYRAQEVLETLTGGGLIE